MPPTELAGCPPAAGTFPLNKLLLRKQIFLYCKIKGNKGSLRETLTEELFYVAAEI